MCVYVCMMWSTVLLTPFLASIYSCAWEENRTRWGSQRSRNNKVWLGCSKQCKAEHKSKSRLPQRDEYLWYHWVACTYIAAVQVSCPIPVDTPHLFNSTGPVNRVFPVASLVHKCKNVFNKTASRLVQDLTQQRAVPVVKIVCVGTIDEGDTSRW